MNILIDRNPTSVYIDDVEYPINHDHRTSILFEMAIKDPELSEMEKLSVALNLYYDNIPKDIEKAWENIIWFYTLGEMDNKEKDKEGGQESNSFKEEIYSFEHDGDYIFSSFLTSYNIDLSEEDLHWWKFMKLFNTLPEDTIIKKIIEIRNTKISSKMSKEERDKWRRLKDIYKLPEKENIDDDGHNFGEAISALF